MPRRKQLLGEGRADTVLGYGRVCLSRSRCLFGAECHSPRMMFSIQAFFADCVMQIGTIHVIMAPITDMEITATPNVPEHL